MNGLLATQHLNISHIYCINTRIFCFERKQGQGIFLLELKFTPKLIYFMLLYLLTPTCLLLTTLERERFNSKPAGDHINPFYIIPSTEYQSLSREYQPGNVSRKYCSWLYFRVLYDCLPSEIRFVTPDQKL